MDEHIFALYGLVSVQISGCLFKAPKELAFSRTATSLISLKMKQPTKNVLVFVDNIHTLGFLERTPYPTPVNLESPKLPTRVAILTSIPAYIRTRQKVGFLQL